VRHSSCFLRLALPDRVRVSCSRLQGLPRRHPRISPALELVGR
jgi:hypothetical protein